MPDTASDLSRRLSREAETVCRHYLANGRREGRYWLVGDVDNTPGRSLFVRLTGPESGKGAAGKWTDAATGEHGDMLDLIAAARKFDTLREVLDEARAFLRLPRPEPTPTHRQEAAPQGSSEAARRLWAISQPIHGTIAEAYLRSRGITDLRSCGSLRFHPRCWYRGDADDPADCGRDAWPALIAAVRDTSGKLTGVSRTWLDPDGTSKASLATPRRAMGHLLGNGVRFGVADDVMAAGEGIETMLSLRQVTPTLPMVAALSANHLAALELPSTLNRLYLVRDDDPAGRMAVDTLASRAGQVGVEVLVLDATLGDLNDDLRLLGRAALATGMRLQLAPEDVARFLALDGSDRSAA
ncbi:MAG TPA: toprim domain-containing protein [Microvirga sp.]|jgi:hypothetical protein|nr:toprim domain-containing protein [Microvirga sp.]